MKISQQWNEMFDKFCCIDTKLYIDGGTIVVHTPVYDIPSGNPYTTPLNTFLCMKKSETSWGDLDVNPYDGKYRGVPA